MGKYKRLERNLIQKGVIIDYYQDVMELPEKQKATWDLIDHKGAAAIVAIDENNKILMVRQYRNALERETLEIPAGGLNQGEDMKSCAIRELEEETGYYTSSAEHLIDIYTSVAYSNEKIGIYFTDRLFRSKQNLDEDEYIAIERYSLEEVVEMILNGIIQDSKTVSAIFAYQRKYKMKDK